LDAAKILEIQEWLVSGALGAVDDAALLQGLCGRLNAAGMALWRATVAVESLHPTIEGHFYEWRRAKGEAGRREYGRSDWNTRAQDWRRSPFYYLLETKQTRFRRRNDEMHRAGEFPILDELFAEDVTEYIAYVMVFNDADNPNEVDALYSSWATDRPGGFAEWELAVLDRLLPTLTLGLRNRAVTRSTENVLQVYLGRDAGGRVLRGQIERGKAAAIRAVLWFSDLAGFARIVDSTPQDQVVPLLNDYAECQVDAIQAQGGQVLKFMGDGLLAIFAGDDPAIACRHALDAADDALQRLAQVNARREAQQLPTTRFYLGLHIGDVMYGNIGTSDRLDFTVVGRAVNEVSRIQALCKSLERDVILSSAFVQSAMPLAANRVASLGRYALRSVRLPQELFILDPDAAR